MYKERKTGKGIDINALMTNSKYHETSIFQDCFGVSYMVKNGLLCYSDSQKPCKHIIDYVCVIAADVFFKEFTCIKTYTFKKKYKDYTLQTSENNKSIDLTALMSNIENREKVFIDNMCHYYMVHSDSSLRHSFDGIDFSSISRCTVTNFLKRYIPVEEKYYVRLKDTECYVSYSELIGKSKEHAKVFTLKAAKSVVAYSEKRNNGKSKLEIVL